MKKLQFFILVVFSAAFLQLQAQNEIPKGFGKGSVTLSDGTIVTGSVKENIRSDASLIIISAADGKKKKYDGNELLAADTDSSRYICIKGDFFKIICMGELCFLQKSSNASGKAVYNGTEALFINGTEGRVNDYFFYDKAQKQLKLLTKKDVSKIVDGTFKDCIEAIAKAKETGYDMNQLGQAVVIYNHSKEK